jgi:hypothetical protein
LLGLVTAQGKFNGEQAQVGYEGIVSHLGLLHFTPALPPHLGRCDEIESVADVVLVEAVFVPPDFIPRDRGTVDSLQLSYQPAGLFWAERRGKPAELNAGIRLTRASDKAMDDESALAHRISQAEGINVALKGVGKALVDLAQPTFGL